MSLTRRDLFRGGRKASAPRPPWALVEDAFLARCSRCGDCVGVCREKVLGIGDGGFPTIGFARGGCSFCGDCVAVCKPGALARHDGRALPLVVAAGTGCLSLHGTACRVCGEWCGDGAIGFRLMIGGRAEVRVDAERCNGCGACVARCPVGAITVQQRPAGQQRSEGQERSEGRPREESAECA